MKTIKITVCTYTLHENTARATNVVNYWVKRRGKRFDLITTNRKTGKAKVVGQSDAIESAVAIIGHRHRKQLAA